MNVHKNARLTPHRRGKMVRQVAERADAEGRRAKQLPADGSQVGRSLSSAKAWPVCKIAVLGRIACVGRRLMSSSSGSRLCGGNASPGSRSPPKLGMSPATVSRILRRLGLNGSARWNRPGRCGATSANSRAN